MSQYETDISNSSTPHLPRINTGFDSPGSDYMTAIKSNQVPRSFNRTHSMTISHSENGESDADVVTQPQQKNKSSTSGTSSTHGHTTKSKCSRHHDIETGNPVSCLNKKLPIVKMKQGHVSPNDSVKSAKYCDRKLSRIVHAPLSHSACHSSRTRGSYDASVMTLSSYKLSMLDSVSNNNPFSGQNTPDEHQMAWVPPKITDEQYAELKNKCLKGGKFKGLLLKYFKEEKKPWEEREESDDDGYDTDLDKQLGFELIADEKSREVLEDGIFPEYKQDCRTFRSNPNSYFLRRCLDDDLYMRYRYLSKGDSITVSNQVKNHLTMSTIDLKDNGIGPHGMKYFRNLLYENKHLTELNLTCNNLGVMGAKYLRSALMSNCFLTKLDISGNKFGERGGKYCAGIIEDNVTLEELKISKNAIGDIGADFISKALASNVSLKLLDISWNHISPKGAVKIADAVKTNTELEVLRAKMNGFAEEGGKAMVAAIRQNNVIKEVDLSYNRINDPVIKLLSSSLDSVLSLQILKLAGNCLTVKPAADFLSTLMTSIAPLRHVNFEGLHVTDDFKGLCNALHIVHNIDIVYEEPPSKRDVTTDSLTRRLVALCEFMEDEELEVEDLYPDYEDMQGTEEGQIMISIGDAICALEVILTYPDLQVKEYRRHLSRRSTVFPEVTGLFPHINSAVTGKVTRPEKLQRLKSKLLGGKKRTFLVSEFAIVYDQVICGKDPLREKPLRTHLRRSIKVERQMKERKLRLQQRRSVFS